VVLSAVALALQQPWLAIVLAIGFLLRVISGPKLSPLALLASRVIVPRLPWPPRMVAGPPKRFAQTIGLAFSLAAALLFYAFSLSGVYQPRDGIFAETEGGGTSPVDAPREVRAREAEAALAWYKTITVDAFG